MMSGFKWIIFSLSAACSGGEGLPQASLPSSLPLPADSSKMLESVPAGKASSADQKGLKYKTLWTQNTSPQGFKLQLIAEGLGTPWGLAFLNEDELLWTEREGRLKKIRLSTGKITVISVSQGRGFKDLYVGGQGGLMDLILHPDFSSNAKIYFTYSIEKGGRQSTALAVGVLKGHQIKNLKVLMVAKPFVGASRHFGSRLVFDSKGFLFMTVGDRTETDSAQSLRSHLGKLLRLNEDGIAPLDNPFSDVKNALPEIWTLGHRNPQGLFIHPKSQEIYLQEHGPKGGDEINRIQRGKNYGWPIVTHGVTYFGGFKIGEGTHKAGIEPSVKYFKPSIAPGGFLIYPGKTFPAWQGDFFSASLALSHINRLKIQNGDKVFEEERMFSSLELRFRHVVESPDGLIYITADQGMIMRIVPLE